MKENLVVDMKALSYLVTLIISVVLFFIFNILGSAVGGIISYFAIKKIENEQKLKFSSLLPGLAIAAIITTAAYFLYLDYQEKQVSVITGYDLKQECKEIKKGSTTEPSIRESLCYLVDLEKKGLSVTMLLHIPIYIGTAFICHLILRRK